DLQEWCEARVRGPVDWHLVHHADLAACLGRHEETMRAMEGALPAAQESGKPAQGLGDLSLRTISEDTSPIVRLVHSTLYDALKLNASDIHLECGPEGLLIKYRLDGVLSQMGSIDGTGHAEQVVSRIKIMAEL